MFRIYQRGDGDGVHLGGPVGEPWATEYETEEAALAEIDAQTKLVGALPPERFIIVNDGLPPVQHTYPNAPLEIAGESLFQKVKAALDGQQIGERPVDPPSMPAPAHLLDASIWNRARASSGCSKGAHLIYRRDPTKERTDLADVVGDPLGKPCETMSEAEALRVVLAAQMNIEPWGLVIVVAEGAVPVED